MNILLCGASGFIGRHLAEALEARGHAVRRGVRGAARHAASGAGKSWVDVDFLRDTQASHWAPRLHGVDVVINAVGILKEQGTQTFSALHVQGPRALFEACAQAGVQRVIQVSALGADEQATTAYHLSKMAADDALLALPVNGVVLQPSLVFGPRGASARLFMAWASLPVVPLPGRGEQRIQPVHLDDLVQAVVTLVEAPHRHVCGRLVVAGREALSLKDYLLTLRRSLGLGRGWCLPMPKALVGRVARWGKRWPQLPLDEDAWRMLERGNTGDSTALRALLGRPPRQPSEFIRADEGLALGRQAALVWLLPLLRLSLATVWLVSGVVSMGLYPVDDSLAMLAQVGVHGGLALAMLFGAAGLDLALGVITLWRPGRRLWLVQMALVLGYTAVITLCLPEQWLHPFAPVAKNLPFLAVLWLLYILETRR